VFFNMLVEDGVRNKGSSRNSRGLLLEYEGIGYVALIDAIHIPTLLQIQMGFTLCCCFLESSTRVIDSKGNESKTQESEDKGQIPRIPKNRIDKIFNVPKNSNGSKDKEHSLFGVDRAGQQDNVDNEVKEGEIIVVVDRPSEEGCPASPIEPYTCKISPERKLLRRILVGYYIRSTNKKGAKYNRDPRINFDSGFGDQIVDGIDGDAQSSEYQESISLEYDSQYHQSKTDATICNLVFPVILVNLKEHVCQAARESKQAKDVTPEGKVLLSLNAINSVVGKQEQTAKPNRYPIPLFFSQIPQRHAIDQRSDVSLSNEKEGKGKRGGQEWPGYKVQSDPAGHNHRAGLEDARNVFREVIEVLF